MAFIPELIGQPYDFKLEMAYRHRVLREGMALYAAYGEYLNVKFGDYFVNLYLQFDKHSPTKEMVFGKLHLSFNTREYFPINVISYFLSTDPMDTRVLVSMDSMKGSSVFVVDLITKHIVKDVLLGQSLTAQLSVHSRDVTIYSKEEHYERYAKYKHYPLGIMLSKAYESYYSETAFQVLNNKILKNKAKFSTAEVIITGEIVYVDKIWDYINGKRSYLTTQVGVKTDFGIMPVVFHRANNAILDIKPGNIIEATGYLVGDIAVGYFMSGSLSDA